MPFTQNTLSIKVYAPALEEDPIRLVAAVNALERAFHGLHLTWTVSAEHQLVPLPQRDEWLAQTWMAGGIPFVCNNDEHSPVTMSALELPATSGPGGQPLLDVHTELPLNTTAIAAAANLLEAMAESTHALWGHATPFDAAADIAEQTAPTLAGPPSPPRGLPALKLPRNIRSSAIPHRLGWLNYWSAAAACAIGFPEPTRDEDLLSRSRRTASGGWVVALTQAPLDLGSPSHLDALLHTYERFPAIGGRAPPP